MILSLDTATGFYALPLTPDAPVVYVRPDGDDTADGSEATPVATIAAARKKLTKGRPGAILLKSGALWKDQQLWVDGGTPDAPQVVGVYGGDARAVIDTSSPDPGESALQVRGPSFLSDIEFVCEPGRSGCSVRGKFELVAQNVLVRDAGLGWDLSEADTLFHRCITVDCYDPKGDKSQGTFTTLGGRLRATQCVWHRCGWKYGVPLTFFASDKNHCIYVHQSAAPATLDECFIGEGCSHGSQLRAGGTVRRSVYYRNPIGGFAQSNVGLIEDTYFEQQNATQLGHGTCPTAEHRGWGWDLEAAYAEMNRCGFNRGGSAHPSSKAIELSKVNPDRTPPRKTDYPGIWVNATRVANWIGGVHATAPASEIGKADVEIDGPLPRWRGFTVDPHVETVRNLRRGSDWGLIAKLAADGYASLEQVLPAAVVRPLTSFAAKAMRETADVLEKV